MQNIENWDGQITRADLGMTSLRVGESVPIFAQNGLLGCPTQVWKWKKKLASLRARVLLK